MQGIVYSIYPDLLVVLNCYGTSRLNKQLSNLSAKKRCIETLLLASAHPKRHTSSTSSSSSGGLPSKTLRGKYWFGCSPEIPNPGRSYWISSLPTPDSLRTSTSLLLIRIKKSNILNARTDARHGQCFFSLMMQMMGLLYTFADLVIIAFANEPHVCPSQKPWTWAHLGHPLSLGPTNVNSLLPSKGYQASLYQV